MASALSLQAQSALLTRWYPRVNPHFETVGHTEWLIFELTQQPTPTSEKYRVLIQYTIGKRPLVFVLDPKLVVEAHGEPTPHLNADGTLCLYDPGKAQWTAADPLIYTVVQWTSRWLFHYENWLAFGVWRGDEDLNATIKSHDPLTALPAEGR